MQNALFYPVSCIAFESGTSETQIRRIEKGQINKGISTLVAIAKALNVPPKELLNFPLSENK